MGRGEDLTGPGQSVLSFEGKEKGFASIDCFIELWSPERCVNTQVGCPSSCGSPVSAVGSASQPASRPRWTRAVAVPVTPVTALSAEPPLPCPSCTPLCFSLAFVSSASNLGILSFSGTVRVLPFFSSHHLIFIKCVFF